MAKICFKQLASADLIGFVLTSLLISGACDGLVGSAGSGALGQQLGDLVAVQPPGVRLRGRARAVVYDALPWAPTQVPSLNCTCTCIGEDNEAAIGQ